MELWLSIQKDCNAVKALKNQRNKDNPVSMSCAAVASSDYHP